MIALIGAGPLGIEMAVALKNANLDYLHFEAGQIGATMAWWAPGTRWFSSTERISIAGVPLVTQGQEKATREEYLAYLRAVVEQFQLKIQTYTLVNGIRRAAGGAERQFALSLRSALHENAPEQFLAVDKIILANGGTATPNLLNVPGENLPHVSHYFQDPHAYFGKKVLIVGGRNSAVEAAMRCYRIGAQVHFSYYGTAVDAKDIKYWLYPEFSSLVKSGKIVGHFETRVREILPDRILLAKSGGGVGARGGGEELPADFVLLLTGYRADMSLAMMAGVQLTGDQQLPIFNPDTMETNVPGIYVAGTAVAGTQRRYKIFLENCHIHVDRILAHLTGKSVPLLSSPTFERPES